MFFCFFFVKIKKNDQHGQIQFAKLHCEANVISFMSFSVESPLCVLRKRDLPETLNILPKNPLIN